MATTTAESATLARPTLIFGRFRFWLFMVGAVRGHLLLGQGQGPRDQGQVAGTDPGGLGRARPGPPGTENALPRNRLTSQARDMAPGSCGKPSGAAWRLTIF